MAHLALRVGSPRAKEGAGVGGLRACCQHILLAKSGKRHPAPAQLLVFAVLCPALLQKGSDKRRDRNTAPVAWWGIPLLRQRGNWKVKLGAGILIHPKGIRWLAWIHDVNSEEQIHFLLLSGNTNEKINSYHFSFSKNEAGSSVLLHQKQDRPSTAARLARCFRKSIHQTHLLDSHHGSLLWFSLLAPMGSASGGQSFWFTDPSWLQQTSAFPPDTAAFAVRTAS